MPMSKRKCFWLALLVIFAFKLGPAAILTMNMRITPTRSNVGKKRVSKIGDRERKTLT